MELVKDVVVDFCLFSLIEGFILCKFYEKICKLNKFKFNEIFILSLINCLISTLLPPVFYQIVIILWIGIFLKIFKKINYIIGLKYGLFSMIFVLVIEMTFCMLYETIFGINFSKMNSMFLFFINIPMKILEIFIIYLIGGNKIEALGRTNS